MSLSTIILLVGGTLAAIGAMTLWFWRSSTYTRPGDEGPDKKDDDGPKGGAS